MKRKDISQCEMEIIECDCGYHLGVDSTFIEQVGHFITECPSCKKKINTEILDSQSIEFITED